MFYLVKSRSKDDFLSIKFNKSRDKSFDATIGSTTVFVRI